MEENNKDNWEEEATDSEVIEPVVITVPTTATSERTQEKEEVEIPKNPEVVIGTTYKPEDIAPQRDLDVGKPKDGVADLGAIIEKSQEKKIFITLDNSVNEVLSLNKQGKDLYFEDGAKFCRLGPAALKELSFENTARYNLAFVSTEMDKEAKPTSKLNITPRFATATARMDVKVLDPNIKPCWKRPEETRMAEVAGYAYAIEGKHVQTFAANDGENPKIGKAGDPELILMYITKEKHQAMIKAASDKSKRRDGAVMSGAKSVLEQMGGKPFEDVRDDHKWGKIS